MTNIRPIRNLILAYVGALVAGFLLYLALIASPLLASISLLFYRGVFIAFISALLLALLINWAARWLRSLDLSTAIGAVALSLAFNISFLIVFPVTFDRSITMFLLARIERQNGQLTPPMLEQVFIREYLGDLRQIDRRVREQTLSGNIVQRNDGRIELTPQGSRLLDSGRLIGGWFGADPRFVTPPPPSKAH
ncbi:hypothetical protein ACKU27_09335 [Sphingobium yanoikuyae]|jgi:predicted PurR-regulated permease PerM|uniref:hypothetical protein n=1 Tax=Sphingobium yanoikuyae TaxID=13690 RepID=UPI002FDD0D5D